MTDNTNKLMLEIDELKKQNKELEEKMNAYSQFPKNIDWYNVKEEDVPPFIPPIKYGKVVRINNDNSFIFATQILFLNNTNNIKTSSLYKFAIHLNGITSVKPQRLSDPKSNQEKNTTTDVLKKMILNHVVELRSMSINSINNNDRLYATVYLHEINVNDYLIQNKYATATKGKNEKIRRMSEPSSYTNHKKITRSSFENVDNSCNILISKKNNFLPPINLKEQRPNSRSSNSSSIVETDCFLSHNWGENKQNHHFVSKINDELVKRGLNTWFDEDKIEGNIRYKMAQGIDNTKCIVVFITKEYRDKVNGTDMRDNAKYEFTYAVNQHGSQYMVPVIMEPEMKEIHKWKGELGAALGSILYVDLSDPQMSSGDLDKRYDELYKRIKHIVNKRKLI